MKTEVIKYIGFYDTDVHADENRNTFLAATNKMNYISSAIIESGFSIDIISPSWSGNSKGNYKSRMEQIAPGVRLLVSSTFGAHSRFMRILRILWSWVWLFIYLCFNTRRNEKVLVYHSMMLMVPIMMAKKIKKFKLVLEVEEIYQDVTEFSNRMKKCEYKFLDSADKYIFPTELINQKINVVNKPHSIIHGTYKVEENRGCKFNDGKIHIVYAGTFDPRKGGALAAEVAEYLPKNYHVHIIGFGSKNDTGMLLQKIDELSNNTEASVTYDGLLNGEEYIKFLQKCDIGLSTQIPVAAYNETSFPSKILSYMANGLRVVSIRIRAIELSAIGHSIYYYEKPNPENIANTILSIDINEQYDSKDLIRRLDEEFKKNIKNLMTY